MTELLQVTVIGLATTAAMWTLITLRYGTRAACERSGRKHAWIAWWASPPHLLAQLATMLVGFVVIGYVVRDLLNLPHHDPHLLDWMALATACVAVVVHFWDAIARFPPRCLYALGFIFDGMLLVHRGLSPGKLLVWTSVCELTGLLLAAALLGWIWKRFPLVACTLRIPDRGDRWSGQWFCWSQAVLAAVAVLQIGWILLDSSFGGMGEGKALLGLSGHWASCPAALMLLGSTIVMAWQSRGRWRGGWQNAAMGAGIVFTNSIGWARIDSASPGAWPQRVVVLLVSATMMTLLTRFGFSRVLPWSGDWITRTRRAAPVFGGTALLLAIVVLVRWAIS